MSGSGAHPRGRGLPVRADSLTEPLAAYSGDLGTGFTGVPNRGLTYDS